MHRGVYDDRPIYGCEVSGMRDLAVSRPKPSVALLTFYKGQLEELMKARRVRERERESHS